MVPVAVAASGRPPTGTSEAAADERARRLQEDCVHEEEVREAKRKARPELATSDMWVAKDFLHRFDLNMDKVDDTLERIHQDQVSEEEFIRR